MNRAPRRPERLRIWQQNAHKSRIAQEHILATANPREWDLIFLQEPWFDSYGNTRGNHFFHVIYPATFLTDKNTPTRSIILVNTNILKDTYTELAVPSNDVTAIRLSVQGRYFSFFNVYNDCTHNDTLDILRTYLNANMRTVIPTPDDHMFWFRDFNRHHPCWEDERNAHTYNTDNFIAPLMDLLFDHSMVLALPPYTPTLRTSAGNWTRPDNVWRTDNLANPVIACNTDSFLLPPNCDHLPIITTLDLSVPRSTGKIRFNFRDTPWETFRELLEARLT